MRRTASSLRRIDLELRFRRNASWAVAEVVASALVLFLLYRIIVGQLGVKALGIWSLVLATTSLARLADLGAAAGLGRFVAIAGARDERDKTVSYVETAIVTNFLLYLAIALVFWAPAYYALSLTVSGAALDTARTLLPFTLISFVLISVAGATTGAVVGQQRSDQKSMMIIAGLLLQFAAAALLVPLGGLRGLAWAQIAQNVLVITLGWFIFLKNHHREWCFRFPYRWHRDIFRELLGFGAKLQAANIIAFLYDPTVKFLMSSFGGLEALGFFEMSQRLVQQVRQIVVMPNQVLMPGFAHLMERQPEKIARLYHKAATLTLVVGFILLGAVSLASPVICYLWIGHESSLFVRFTVILAACWFANLVAAPAYLLGIASGRIWWNVCGHLVATIGAFGVGFILGRLFGATGVAVGAGGMMAIGSLLSMIMNCRSMGIHPLPEVRDFYLLSSRIASMLKTQYELIHRR
jgi:O-antigen/teichoic acid export membrane protein